MAECYSLYGNIQKETHKETEKIFLVRLLPDCCIRNPSTSTSYLKSNKETLVLVQFEKIFFSKKLATLFGQNTMWDDNTGFQNELLSRHCTYIGGFLSKYIFDVRFRY